MPELADRIDRYRAALAEVEAAALAVMHEMKDRILAADDGGEAERLVLGFERACRTVQRSVALNLRLDYELSRQARQTEAAAKADTEARTERRKAEVRCVLERQAYAQGSDRYLARARLCALDEILKEDGFKGDFADWPIEPYIARLRYDVGLDEAAPATPDGAPPEPPRGVLWRPRLTGEFFPPGTPVFSDEDFEDEDAELEAQYESSS